MSSDGENTDHKRLQQAILYKKYEIDLQRYDEANRIIRELMFPTDTDERRKLRAATIREQVAKQYPYPAWMTGNEPATSPSAPKSPEPTIHIGFETTAQGWNYIMNLLLDDGNPAWKEFNLSVARIITVALTRAKRAATTPPPQEDERPTPESQGYHLGDDAQYHNDEYFGERFGSYENYERLSDEASDMGFPDAETYKNWLDD